MPGLDCLKSRKNMAKNDEGMIFVVYLGFL